VYLFGVSTVLRFGTYPKSGDPVLGSDDRLEGELHVGGGQLLPVVEHDPGLELEGERVALRRNGPGSSHTGDQLSGRAVVGEAVVDHAHDFRKVVALEHGVESDGGLDLQDLERPAALGLGAARRARPERRGTTARDCSHRRTADEGPAGHRESRGQLGPMVPHARLFTPVVCATGWTWMIPRR
jgi:hypothetical protein